MDVQIRCVCPLRAGAPQHPDGDTVTLRDRLDFRSVMAIRNQAALLKSADPDAPMGEWIATMTEGYLLYGVAAWTLLDDQGKPLPVSKANIRERILEDIEVASVVADEADGLYARVVLLPLLVGAATSSQPSSTSESTSPPSSETTPSPGSSLTSVKPSSQSSTTSTPTDATGTISGVPAGGSSS